MAANSQPAGCSGSGALLLDATAPDLAGIQSIVDYHGAEGERPGAEQALRRIGCETLEGGVLWLRHKAEDAPSPTP
jgi:hypothetical protein